LVDMSVAVSVAARVGGRHRVRMPTAVVRTTPRAQILDRAELEARPVGG
jgi:hypothetical protein